ncbi:MAG: hypothetical protein WBP41_14225 [Saprospiraceae bacterium]
MRTFIVPNGIGMSKLSHRGSLIALEQENAIGNIPTWDFAET